MKIPATGKTKQTPLEFHNQLVDQVVGNAKRTGIHLRPAAQWFLWLVSSLLVMAFFWIRMGVQQNIVQVMHQMPPLLFVLTAFVGASLAAWEAISSSVPGRQAGNLYLLTAVMVLFALVSIPFIFFAQPGPWAVGTAFINGGKCAEGVAFSGLIPWIFMGWMLSRNASFHAWWTGLWSGVSAFLMGTITLQVHCPDWDMDHVLAAHLLPAAIGTLAASFLGAFWFSRWKK